MSAGESDTHEKAESASVWPPLHLVAECGDVEGVRSLLSDGGATCEEIEDNWTPLHLSAEQGHCEVVAALLEARASVGKRTSNGLTPLHLATLAKHVDVVVLLAKEQTGLDEPMAHTSVRVGVITDRTTHGTEHEMNGNMPMCCCVTFSRAAAPCHLFSWVSAAFGLVAWAFSTYVRPHR